VLLSEAFELYIQDRIVFANKSPKTEESYEYTKRALLKFAGDLELKDLTFIIIRNWAEGMRKRGLVSGTIRGYIVNTRAVLQYMKLLGNECLDPERITIPSRVDPTPSFLTPQEVAQLLTIINKTPKCSSVIKARNQAIVSLLYSSGIRASELCSLNRDDVGGEVFTVLGKGGKRRPCMIDSRAKELLNRYLSLRTDNLQALFIESDGSRLKPGTLQSLFRRMSRRFGKPVHPHTIRHSFANDLMRKGCHIYPLSRLMGHSSIATTQTYFQMYDPELLEVHRKYHSI